MDSFTLERFAREGFSAVPGDQLTDLWVWCRDSCEATGDGRYCSIAETLRSVDDWRTEHDERGGVPASLLAEIEAVITTLLPDVIGPTDPADGAPLARMMREEVQRLLLGPSGWERLGYL